MRWNAPGVRITNHIGPIASLMASAAGIADTAVCRIIATLAGQAEAEETKSDRCSINPR
jgi:hypothetical protein